MQHSSYIFKILSVDIFKGIPVYRLIQYDL